MQILINDKKNYFSVIFLSLIIIISIFLFKKYFSSNENYTEQNNIEKISKNIIEDIKYQSSDNNGNSYIITAKNGINLLDQKNKIRLEDVKAKLIFDNQKEITVISNFAIYNQDNYDTEFQESVKIDYETQKIKCENLKVKFSENIAILKKNLVFENLNMKMLADQMEVDLLSRTSKIYMLNDSDKIEVTYFQKNGTN